MTPQDDLDTPKPIGLKSTSDYRSGAHDLSLASWEGREAYRRSVGLILLEAADRVAPEIALRLGPSLGTGQIAHALDPMRARAVIPELQVAFEAIVMSDSIFREEVWAIDAARRKFVESGFPDSAKALRTRRETSVTLVSCGTVYAISLGRFLPSAKSIRDIRLLPHPDGILVDFGAPIRDFSPRLQGEAIDTVANELRTQRFGGEMVEGHKHWLRALGVTSVGEFNELCISGQVTEFVRVAEGFHEKRIGRVADRIAESADRIRVICIAGPSSSGKTTFIKRLKVQLEVNGVRPIGLSLDDYYVDRSRTPRDESGDYDFEALQALDLPLLTEHLARVTAGETVKTAHYDFRSGRSLPDGGDEIRLQSNQVLMLEGIHGLNPAILGSALSPEQAFRIFVHPATTLPFDRLTTVTAEDVRLVRRIVRDRHTREISARDNINRWPSVRRGEKLYIFPSQHHADTVFDTSLAYELSVLKVYADRYLLEVPEDDHAFTTASRLRKLLDHFVTIDPDHVPPTSVLREFIGGSGFEY